MSSIKALPISRSDIISIKGAIYGEWGGQQSIVPQWKRGMSNTVTSSNSGEYDGGDRVIGFGAYHVDGDLLITAGWGDGSEYQHPSDAGAE